jgi:uncharacterized membrane protein
MSKHPLSVTILVVIVLSFTAYNCVRLYETIQNWDLLLKYNSRLGPFYMVSVALAWILIGIALNFGLVKNNPRSILFTNLAAFTYACWYWFDRTIFQYGQHSIVIPLGGTLVMLLSIFFLSRYIQTHHFVKLRDSHDR